MTRLLLVISAMIFTGCLKTRSDVKEFEQRQVVQQQVVGLQKTSADVQGRFSEIQEQLRDLNGRIEVLENKTSAHQQNLDKESKQTSALHQETGQKLQILQEALEKLEQQHLQLNAEIQALKAEKLGQTAEKTVKKIDKDLFQTAEDLFDRKDWKKAILTYQKFREAQPKAKHFAEATYKIGVSFQELGLKDEAKTFYDEVIAKFPQSDEARKARTRLRNLKK